ncbi:hypothetical protein TNCV_4568001 [Trichonephila clavipes]|nr:hypothetical protein TNCV_4568001 [Trichonephila clavipes]
MLPIVICEGESSPTNFLLHCRLEFHVSSRWAIGFGVESDEKTTHYLGVHRNGNSKEKPLLHPQLKASQGSKEGDQPHVILEHPKHALKGPVIELTTSYIELFPVRGKHPQCEPCVVSLYHPATPRYCLLSGHSGCHI